MICPEKSIVLMCRVVLMVGKGLGEREGEDGREREGGRERVRDGDRGSKGMEDRSKCYE